MKKKLKEFFASQDRGSYLVFLFFFAYFLLIFFTFRDYGITIDEPMNHIYSVHVHSYYSSFFQDPSAITFMAYPYGNFFDFWALLFQKISPWRQYETQHLLSAFLGLIGAYYVYLLAKHLSGSRYFGLLGALFLFLTPRYFGNSFNNPKDIPFAVLYILFLYYLCRSIPYWRGRVPRGLLIKTGIVGGFLMGIRIGGILVYCYFALFALLYQLYLWKAQKKNLITIDLLRNTFFPFVISYAVMLIFWPWGQQNPFYNPFKALQIFSSAILILKFPFEGQVIAGNHLPWHYTLKWFYISTPPLILIGFVLFLILFPSRGKGKRWEISLLTFALLFPHFYFILKKPALYNGIRHFLFLFPPLALLGTLGFYFLFLSLPQKITRAKTFRIGAPALLLALLLPQVHWYIKSHPHENLYFNFTVGGIEGAPGKYELDYWAGSSKQACEWLNRYGAEKNQPTKIKIAIDNRHTVIFEAWREDVFAYYLNPRYFELEKKEERADFLIRSTSDFYTSSFADKAKYRAHNFKEIQVLGVPIMVIYRIVPRSSSGKSRGHPLR